MCPFFSESWTIQQYSSTFSLRIICRIYLDSGGNTKHRICTARCFIKINFLRLEMFSWLTAYANISFLSWNLSYSRTCHRNWSTSGKNSLTFRGENQTFSFSCTFQEYCNFQDFQKLCQQRSAIFLIVVHNLSLFPVPRFFNHPCSFLFIPVLL